MAAILCIGCGAVGDSDGAALYCNSCYEELQEENKRLKTLLDQLGEGVLLIAMERQRQVVEEGWTPDHDDQHKHGEMCAAAAVYAFTPKQRFQVHASQFWPWDMAWFKPGNRIRELQKAGALIAAEIDRLNRRAVTHASAAPINWPAEFRAFAQSHGVDPEVVECFVDFWWPILEKEGRLDLAQIMRELYDFRVVMQEVSKVYDQLTNGKFSKPNTAAEYIIAAVEENYSDTGE